MSAPWGHKLTAVVYVEGPGGHAEVAAGELAGALQGLTSDGIDFAGISIDVVQDEPWDQGAA